MDKYLALRTILCPSILWKGTITDDLVLHYMGSAVSALAVSAKPLSPNGEKGFPKQPAFVIKQQRFH